MINVTLTDTTVANATRVPYTLNEGTTLGQFFAKVRPTANPDQYSILVNLNKHVSANTVLRDGDRVTIEVAKVGGGGMDTRLLQSLPPDARAGLEEAANGFVKAFTAVARACNSVTVLLSTGVGFAKPMAIDKGTTLAQFIQANLTRGVLYLVNGDDVGGAYTLQDGDIIGPR